MIDMSNWKEFRVGDFFHGIRGTSRKMQELNEGKTPVIAAARYNQGIAGYYDVPSEYENAITISCNGVGCGSTYYHDYPFAITGDAVVLENIGNVPIGALHFIASVYDVYFSRKYSYADKCSADKAEAECISLPATSDGQPDWDYMESYMKAVMEESEKSLESLRKADDAKHLIDVSGWGEFKLSELVDEYYIAKSLDYGHLQEGDTAFINRSQVNNGIQGYVKADAYEKPNCITIGMIGNSKHAFWQTIWFVASQNILVLRNAVWNNYSASFICSIINSLLSDFQDYKDIIKKDDWMQNTKIKLPITSKGEPDWQYMEDYMRRIMDKSEQIISDLQIGA